jgi:hypothetical protein
VKHKLKIYSVRWGNLKPRLLWYVQCEGCQWAPDTRHEWPDGVHRYGRPNQGLVLALGVRHQTKHLTQDGEEFRRVGSCPPCDDYHEINGVNGWPTTS